MVGNWVCAVELLVLVEPDVEGRFGAGEPAGAASTVMILLWVTRALAAGAPVTYRGERGVPV